MEVIAKLRHLRVSPRKVKLVADLIKGLSLPEARAQLRFLGKRATEVIFKLLNSAMANAKHNFNLAEGDLYVKNILVEGGPSLKRWMPRAMGRATPIMKRTSHITLILEQKQKTERKVEPKKKIAKITAKKVKESPSLEEKLPPQPEIVERPIAPTVKQAEPKKPMPRRPYGADSRSKKRFFSRQTFSNIKKMFRRKSI